MHSALKQVTAFAMSFLKDSVQVLRTRLALELAGRLARDGQAPLYLDAMETAILEGAIESGK